MIHQNIDWESKSTVKKGNIGEEIVKTYLEGKGYILYNPTTPGAHVFDNLATKDKTNIFVVEVKTKPRRLYYKDTGINYSHFKTYQEVAEKHNLKVFIFFVDDIEEKIYGNELQNLTKSYYEKGKHYPLYEPHSKIIYFPLANMVDIANLNEMQIKQIRTYHTGRYEYKVQEG